MRRLYGLWTDDDHSALEDVVHPDAVFDGCPPVSSTHMTCGCVQPLHVDTGACDGDGDTTVYYYNINYYNQKNWWCEALILCWYAGSFVGRIAFLKDDAAIPPPKVEPFMSVHYPVSRFNDIVSMLRYEKPLYLSVTVTDEVSLGSVQTKSEPVGEQEAE